MHSGSATACNTLATTGDVNEVLDFCKGQGKSRQTVAHVRQATRIVLDVLRREGEISSNPVDDATMPRFRTATRKERAVLTDEELGAYLGFVHPFKQHRMPVLERQTMACVARCFGGLRTGDLHALDWSAFDIAQGALSGVGLRVGRRSARSSWTCLGCSAASSATGGSATDTRQRAPCSRLGVGGAPVR